MCDSFACLGVQRETEKTDLFKGYHLGGNTVEYN